MEITRTLASGANELKAGEASMVTVGGPSAAYSITGIVGGREGRRLVIFNNTAYPLTLNHDDAASAASRRIRTSDGANKTAPAGGYALLAYNWGIQRWLLIV
ncbi:MAG: hypothetical protein HYR71_12150 [Chloroflexi bacterium]|nr:hypothetical protein [Chloroflexota bacterium]